MVAVSYDVEPPAYPVYRLPAPPPNLTPEQDARFNRFVERMRRELVANAHKGDFTLLTPDEAELELDLHLVKLRHALRRKDHDAASEYAADVANIAGFLWIAMGERT